MITTSVAKSRRNWNLKDYKYNSRQLHITKPANSFILLIILPSRMENNPFQTLCPPVCIIKENNQRLVYWMCSWSGWHFMSTPCWSTRQSDSNGPYVYRLHYLNSNKLLQMESVIFSWHLTKSLYWEQKVKARFCSYTTWVCQPLLMWWMWG